MIKSSDLELAFFGTCAQTFAALVSIFGMFILYRLQIEESRIGQLQERMIGFHESHKKIPFESVLLSMEKLEHERKSDTELSQTIHILLHNYSGAVKKQQWLESAAKRPILIMLGLVFTSLLAMIVTPVYINSNRLEGALLWGTLIISAVPLWEIGVVVFKSIQVD